MKYAIATRRLSNLSFWLFNTTAVGLIAVAPDELRPAWALPIWLSYAIGFGLLDFFSYVTHRIYHAIPDGWRIHALHHSDPYVDITTSVRHHPIEYLLTAALFWLAILVIGIPAVVVFSHAVIFLILSAVIHSKLSLPQWLSQLLRPIIITPDLHLVHHSADPAHANSNFGAVLSIWDRMFGTLLIVPPVQRLRFGVPDIDPQDACRPLPMLLTPLRIGNMNYFTNTYPLADGREIQVSADIRGRVMRLRAMLVENDIIQVAHAHDYRNEPHLAGRNIARFTQDFEEISRVSVPTPLFVFENKKAA